MKIPHRSVLDLQKKFVAARGCRNIQQAKPTKFKKSLTELFTISPKDTATPSRARQALDLLTSPVQAQTQPPVPPPNTPDSASFFSPVSAAPSSNQSSSSTTNTLPPISNHETTPSRPSRKR